MKQKVRNDDYGDIVIDKSVHVPEITKLEVAPPMIVLQFQNMLNPSVHVCIKPNLRKTYWEGDALYIPQNLYSKHIRDISICPRDDDHCEGSVILYVDEDDYYEEKTNIQLVNDINHYIRRSMHDIHDGIMYYF